MSSPLQQRVEETGIAPTESSDAGQLFPTVPAMVARDGDGYVLVGPSGMRSKIRGAISRDIAESLALGAPTAGLRRVALAHPALEELTAWLGEKTVPLTRESAVRLDGIDMLFLELTGQCNERCVHCYADAAPTVTTALSRDVVMRIVDEARALRIPRIQFTGGDPLLCEFLPEAVARARALGFPYIEIYTNGLALTDKLADELAPSRPNFAFSFYSMRPEVHDAVTRTPGSHRRTIAAIDRAIARGLRVRVSIIVTTEDEDIAALDTFFRARGVISVSWSRTFSVGRGTDIAADSQQRAVTPINTETAQETPNASPAAPVLVEHGGHRSPTDEDYGNGKLCVTYGGDVVPCIFQRTTTLGNVGSGKTLAEIIASGGPTKPPRPPRALPLATEVRERLGCPGCQLTDTALNWLDGSR